MKSRVLSRRRLLRGLGTAIALPYLDAMWLARPARAAPLRPSRLAYVYLPNGMHMSAWLPKTLGEGYEMPPTLQPLSSLRSEFLVLSGLTDDPGLAHGDGGGDHARAVGSFLTGVHPRKAEGLGVHAGISADQIAAQYGGAQSRLSSLEMACHTLGNCEPDYDCLYADHLSWRSPTAPLQPAVGPEAVFDRLMGGGSPGESDQQRLARLSHRMSILDFVADDATALKRQLGSVDQHRLDEYLTSVREVERRIDRQRTPLSCITLRAPPAGATSFRERIPLMYDLLAMAFECDITRIATFAVVNELSDQSYDFIGVTGSHHGLSHHGGDPEKQRSLQIINQWHVERFAAFLTRLQAVREGDQSVLSNSMIVFGCGLADGNSHAHDNLPLLLAGRGGGALRPGRHLFFPDNEPLANLHVTLLSALGVPSPRLGDSTRVLPQLSV